MKFASLVILAYNRQEMTQRSLESLRENTSFPYQLIICDDASDVETQKFLFSLVRQGEVSTLLLNVGHNMGIGPAVNRGMQIAKGDYLLKLDADLIYRPGWLEEVVRILDAHPEVGSMGLFKYWHQPCNFPDEFLKDHGDYYEVVDYVGSALCFRRDVWQKFGPWLEDAGHTFSEDIVFKKALRSAGLRLALPKEDLCTNEGFGEHLTSLIKVIDWKDGKHVYNIPRYEPRVFGAKGVTINAKA